VFSSFNARALGLTLAAEETIRLAAENGFGGADLMIRDAIDQGVDLDRLRRTMDDLGLKAGAFPFPFDWRGDHEAFLADMRRLPFHAEAAARVGLTRTATWVMPECPDGLDRVTTWDRHCDRLARIADELDSFQIRLGLEVIGVRSSRPGRNVPFINQLDQLEPLLRELATLSAANIGVVADSWHLHAADETIDAVLAFGVENVVWVHVADLPEGAVLDRGTMIDSERGLPGPRGAVQSSSLLGALSERGYDGPVTAEPLAKCRSLAGSSPAEAARKAAEALKSIWPTGNGKPS
jgi:sugar phosphate isomerase/epimerase